MAAPFKRVCYQAARHSTRPTVRPRRRVETPQWRPLRPLSNTAPTHRAAPLEPDSSNPFVSHLPPATAAQTLDPDFQDEELSSLAHSEVDQHRELREMVRIAAWEMPLLSALHKPFEPPKAKTQPLRWRYTTYMGEQHPAQNKVVVEFDVHYIQGLTHGQREKLRKLAGSRYDHGRQRVRISCESFETQAMNKRYLGDVVQKLIAEAKDPNAETFEDIPLDTRHTKRETKLRFPSEWLLTEDRKAELEASRRQTLLAEGEKVEQNRLVSGAAAIEEARQVKLREVEEPVMAEARQQLPKGKMGKREMGQTKGAQR